MKGIVFQLLEEVVTTHHGVDAWDEWIDAAGVDGAYTSLGSYDDRDLGKLVTAAATALEVEPTEVVRWFGREALPLLAQKYPQFFQRHDSARPFVLSLNRIIHPEVRKLYPGADTPEFVFHDESEVLIMEYRSQRRLCAFAEGLIMGAAAHYRESVQIDHPKCMNRGHAYCEIELRFARL
jgi:predicted hydrocarbon binding protein